jgi:hypothetical protein
MAVSRHDPNGHVSFKPSCGIDLDSLNAHHYSPRRLLERIQTHIFDVGRSNSMRNRLSRGTFDTNILLHHPVLNTWSRRGIFLTCPSRCHNPGLSDV